MSSWVTELEEYLPLQSKWMSPPAEWHSRVTAGVGSKAEQGSSLPSGKRVLRKRVMSFLWRKVDWRVCWFTRWVWWYWLALLILPSWAFTRRTVASWGGARKVLRWGGCPPPSSQGDASPSSSWDGAWCPDLVFRTQVLEYDRVIFTATQSHSALWLAMHFQTALKYKPYPLWANLWTFLSSPSPLWNQNHLPPALRTTSTWKLQIQSSLMTQIPRMI